MAENSDALNILSNSVQGLVPAFMGARKDAAAAQAAAANRAALREMKERELGLKERETMIPGQQAQVLLRRFGMNWDPTRELPVSALNSLSGAYRGNLQAGAGAAKKLHADYPTWKRESLLQAIRATGLDPRLPVPREKVNDVNQLAAANMQAYVDSFNTERGDAGLGPVPYQEPEGIPVDPDGWFKKTAKSFVGGLMGDGTTTQPPAAAPTGVPPRKVPPKKAAPPPVVPEGDTSDLDAIFNGSGG